MHTITSIIFILSLFLSRDVHSFLHFSLIPKQIQIHHISQEMNDLCFVNNRISCHMKRSLSSTLSSKVEDKKNIDTKPSEPSAFDKVASTGLAGILAIAVAEAIFWTLGKIFLFTVIPISYFSVIISRM